MRNHNPAMTGLAMLAGQREGGDAPVEQMRPVAVRFTKYDMARIKASKAKRERKNQKRIGIISGGSV